MSRPLERRTSAEAMKPAELQRLKREAHRRLREAVADYEERLLASELRPGQEVPVHDVQEMSTHKQRSKLQKMTFGSSEKSCLDGPGLPARPPP